MPEDIGINEILLLLFWGKKPNKKDAFPYDVKIEQENLKFSN